MVKSGGARDANQGNLGGYLAGFQENAADREGHTVGDVCRDIGARRDGGRRFWERER